MQFYVVLGLVFALAVAVFAVQNATAVDIKFLGWRFSDISLVLVILSSVAGGSLITILFGLPRQLRTMMKIRELTAQNQRLASELEKFNAGKIQLEEGQKQRPESGDTGSTNKKEAPVDQQLPN
ncbi:putative integral membrane protein [Desulfohalotomaculum tongense]|uniref:LapA family protein n=1 Tax=Desulforadius tongensis TaxID=1216062 RepID=UPI001957A48F|nr:LapA family protein [Desulforadius tongensis]MBM7855313.1 putative integral membrane protein [Desulforadius tongensis]